ncbi:MAG: choice-of-anchor D domain-containing protein [Candidatus Acidiferrales bacterium]
MSLIFSWPVKAAAGMIARERAVAAADSRRRGPRRGVLRAGLCALLVAASALVTSPVRGQSITATVTDNDLPRGIAINPVTNKIYFADDYAGTLTVVDGATNAVSSLSYGANSNWAVVVNPVTNTVYTVDRGLNKVDVFTGATATAPAQFVTAITTGGSNLYAIAINPVTNMIYVCDDGDFRVFVIDGSTNTVTTTVALGGINAPDSVAVNPATNMIYVADSDSNNVSVINGSTNTLLTTVGVGSTPYSLAVNPATNKIYVANSGSNNVSVIDGSTNTVTATLQDPNASGPVAIAVNPETNQIYVGNSGSSNTTIINGANNAVTDVGTNAGTSTFTSVAVDTSTNQAYVANSGTGTVTIINGNTFAVTTQLTAQTATGQIAVNPVTHKAYAADFTSGYQVPITVIDGATNTVLPITPSNQEPAVVAVNPVTNLIYVANSVSNNVSVINGSTNTLLTTVAVDAKPAAIIVDPVNNLVYVANHDGGDITVIDSAFNTSTITFYQTLSPDELAFNPVLNMVYGASRGAGLAFQFSSQDGAQTINANTLFVGTDITAVAVNPAQGYNVYVVNDTPGIQVFDSHGGFTTSTCNASQTPEAMDVNATTNTIYVACGDGTVDIYEQADSFTPGGLYVLTPPSAVRGAAVAVNAATNMAYVADNGSSNVYVINGATIAVSATIPIVSSSSQPVNPVAIAVNVATNKIYVVSQDNQNNTPNVTIIDGATNTILGMIPLSAPGVFTGEIAVNPATGNIYALDWMASTIDVIMENAVLPNALQTTINPLPPIGGLPANATNTTSPTFTFSTLNNLSFSAPMVSAPVTGLYFQVDTMQGSWTPATATPPGSGNFTGAASGVTPGFHILYAYATDGEDGAAGNQGAYSAQNGPLVGAIASYGFLVSPPIATINFYPLDFGSVPLGGVSPSPYPILINEGGSPMTYSYTITGPNANEFIVDPNQSSCATSGTLSANSGCVIYVTFQPTTTGPVTATLTWTDNSLAISNSTQSIGFTGNGVPSTGTVFTGLTVSQSILVGTSSINLSGTISAGGNFPPSGETVAITINSTTQNATIGVNGAFSTAFATSSIPASGTPYPITYNYAGDGSFSAASNSSTTLTVNSSTPGVTVTMTLLGTGTGFVIDGQNLNCSEAAGVTSGTCSGNYAVNSPVTFTANPTAPTTFGGWGGACASSGTSLTCHLTIISSQNVTANFIPPATTVALTFPVGTNPPPQEAVFDCPSHTNPCTDPSAHALQLTIPNVNSIVNVTVLAAEVPPSQADGLCESGNSVLNDFDCRFVTFFSDGTDGNNNTIVPLCDPYANGNCVHYLVYSTTGGPGVEPPASSYSGGVYWQITWNNESFTPPAPYYSGSTPQLYDDPDYPVSQTAPYGTNCSPSTPMLVGITNPQATNPPIYCQFEFNITTFYNPTQQVDSGVGGSTKQFNDVVVAFPPTVAGTNPVVQPPTPSTPAITGACLTGCTLSGSTITFTVGTGGTFQAVPTGYPAPTLTETGALPNGLTINKLTGILGGTPAPGSNGTYTPMSFTATNSAGFVTQIYTLIVSPPVPPPTFTLTLTELGTGTGHVTYGPPPQFTCSEANGLPETGTCSASYASGTPVTLTATPTSPSTFANWGGACSSFGTNPTCNFTINSSQNVTANFIPPPTPVALTFPVGTNPPPQEAVFNCPSNTNPCTDPSAHALQLTIPNVSATVNVTVLATEVPPSQANGLCASTNTVLNDFDCRFVTFFSDGTDGNNNTIVPLCDPYANGNCVHYLVYSTTGGPGVEPPASSYSGGVYWQITWNNEGFVPPAPNYLGSTPQLYDDPDYALTPTSAVGTNCSQPMTINGVNQTYSCQFEFNITTFYNPTQPVDSGVGGSTKQFNDVVVAFPPTVAGTNPVVQPPTPSTPAITATCLTGCSISGSTINFTIGTGGTFQAVPTGYPAPTLTETGPLPNGLTINKLTGIVGGTPATGTSGSFPISFTATNSTGHVTQSFTLTVNEASQTITFPPSPASAVYNTTFTATATSSSGLPVTIAATGVCTISSGTVTMTSGTGTCTLTASQAGNGNFSPATNVVHNVAAALATQTITFPASPASAVYNTTFAATATSSSGLPVTIAATGVCTISSGTVTMTSGTGTCTLTASQAGNGSFGPAPNVVHTVAAAKATQTITFTGVPASAAFGSSFTVAASASSGLPVTVTPSGSCTISGALVTMTAGSGTCSLLASQSGNTNYSAATSKNQSTSATKAGSTTTITSNTPNPSTVNQAVTISFKVTGSGTPTGTVTVTASTGGSCSGTLSSGAGSCTVTFASSGSPTLTAAYSGDGNFNGSTSAGVSQTVNGSSSTLKVSPTSLNFGTVHLDQIGGDFGEITICSPFIPSMPGTLAAGKTCTIAVGFLASAKIFSPTASTATITITDNAAGSPQLIPLSLTVINPQVSLSATNLGFATQKVGTTSAAKTVTLTNTGNTPLTLGTLTVSGNFALVSGSGTTCSNNGTVAAGASCAINVTFKPTAKGTNTGSVKITDNALISPQSISLSGTGN